MIIGYARTSTIDQSAGFEAQLKELEGAKCEKIFREQVSSVAIRAQLERAGCKGVAERKPFCYLSTRQRQYAEQE